MHAITSDAVVIGVDTHKDVHVAVAISGLGARLGTISAPATAEGYRQLADWARGHGTVYAFGVVLEGDRPAIKRAPDSTIIKALQRAHRWWAMLCEQPELTPEALARSEDVSPSYLNRIVRLSFLDPAIVHTILAGEQRASIDLGALTIRPSLPLLWSDQRCALHL